MDAEVFANYLPDGVLDRVLNFYRGFLDDDRVTPGKAGKRAFMKGALKRDDLLPPDLQREIDSRKDGQTTEEYLRAHPRFDAEMFKYF